MTEKEKEKWKDLQSSKAWIKHDDSKMSFTSDKILADLTGGGDFHMAYICIYKAQGK
jgi:ubiquitin carboxyl-terminal hydrolase 14